MDECYFQKALHRLRPDPARCLPDFLQLQIQALARNGGLNDYTTHSTIAHLTGVKLASVFFLLPPVSEQRRIVDLINHANSIRRLRREAQEKARQVIPALFVEMFGDPGVNPMGWPSVPFGDLMSYSRYGPRFHERPYSACGARILRTTDIALDGRTMWDDAPKIEVSDEELDRYALRPNTLLFTRTGATIGKVALFSGSNEPCIAGAYLIECGLSEKLIGTYAWSVFASAYGQQQLVRGSRAVAQPNINAPTIRAIRVPMPPLTLQHAFAERVADLQSIIAQQDRMAAASEQMADGLMARVFSGDA